jgi:hypothetical protein
MKSNELIQNLTSNLKVVTPIKYKLKDYALVLLVGFFSVLFGVAFSGIRSDFQNIILTPSFITQSLVLLMLALLSTVSAMQMSIPSLKKSVSQNIVLATLGFWAITLIYLLVNSNSPFAGWGFSCASEILANSLAPSAALFFMIRNAATLNRFSTGWLVLTAGAAFGALATQLSCSYSDPFHLLIWHAVPVVVIGLLGISIGKFILKKV